MHAKRWEEKEGNKQDTVRRDEGIHVRDILASTPPRALTLGKRGGQSNNNEECHNKAALISLQRKE